MSRAFGPVRLSPVVEAHCDVVHRLREAPSAMLIRSDEELTSYFPPQQGVDLSFESVLRHGMSVHIGASGLRSP